MVSHCDSETRSGFMAVLSARFSNLTEVLRQTLSPMDFVFSLKVGCKLFDRHAPEMVIMASLVTPFVGRLDGEVLAHLNADERSLADAASEALADPHCVAHANRPKTAFKLLNIIVVMLNYRKIQQKSLFSFDSSTLVITLRFFRHLCRPWLLENPGRRDGLGGFK